MDITPRKLIPTALLAAALLSAGTTTAQPVSQGYINEEVLRSRRGSQQQSQPSQPNIPMATYAEQEKRVIIMLDGNGQMFIYPAAPSPRSWARHKTLWAVNDAEYACRRDRGTECVFADGVTGNRACYAVAFSDNYSFNMNTMDYTGSLGVAGVGGQTDGERRDRGSIRANCAAAGPMALQNCRDRAKNTADRNSCKLHVVVSVPY